MPEATNIQMQNFFDQRIRPRAEQFLALLEAIQEDLDEIADEYQRASGTNPFADGRTDGPPHLMQSGNGANPDDMLNFNAFGVAFNTFMTVTQAAAWAVLQRAIVRNPPQG